jgi:hypothetical protein
MFSLYGQFYEQTDGMAVISQLSSMSAGSYMEDCVEMALKQVTHKLVCWFCYMVDNFVIPPYTPEKLERFLDHSTGVYQTIQFTMETLVNAGAWMAYRATRFTENVLILTST